MNKISFTNNALIGDNPFIYRLKLQYDDFFPSENDTIIS